MMKDEPIGNEVLDAYRKTDLLRIFIPHDSIGTPDTYSVYFTYGKKHYYARLENLLLQLGISTESFRRLFGYYGFHWCGLKPEGKQSLANLLGKTIEFKQNKKVIRIYRPG